MRIGAKVPNSGPLPASLGIPAMARTLDEAGFDSLWVSDHVVLPASIDSSYPFAKDGRATWASDTPYVDAIVALGLIAATTSRAAIGTAVLVMALRNPVVLAKQLASLDVVSGGRLRLGAGAGWLEEEFAALGVPFADRGSRLEEWIEIARSCWTGRPAGRASGRYVLPDGILCLPVPAHPIEVLIGGHSARALARAGRIGDGWLGQQSLPELDPDTLGREAAAVREAAESSGRDPAELEIVLRIVESAGRAGELAARLPELARAGVSEVIVDLDWSDGGASAPDELAWLREGAV
jgi:probable F420-dependent oxidoreductase